MRAGKCRPVYVRFAPPHGLARRVPDAVLAGTGTLCRWMIGFMRRREILRLPVSAQGKEAAVRLLFIARISLLTCNGCLCRSLKNDFPCK